MSENLTSRDGSRHVDVKPHFLRCQVRDGHVKLVMVGGRLNVSDSLTKSLPRPAFENHREFMVGSRVPIAALYTSIPNTV